MATRANIELYDGWQEHDTRSTVWQKGVILYHHWDGYPSWMGPRLEGLLKKIKTKLNPAWWDSERVGALIVKLSALKDQLEKGVPTFQPCLRFHGDIDYLWRVFLGPQTGKYEIQCFRIDHDWNKDVVTHLGEVPWREEVKKELARTPLAKPAN